KWVETPAFCAATLSSVSTGPAPAIRTIISCPTDFNSAAAATMSSGRLKGKSLPAKRATIALGGIRIRLRNLSRELTVAREEKRSLSTKWGEKKSCAVG